MTLHRSPDPAALRRLVEQAGLPSSDLDSLDYQHVLAGGSRERPDGVVGLELYGDAALLRSLVVAPDLRGTGLGKTLVEAAEQDARDSGVKRIFLLTTTAAPFFKRLGYVDSSREQAPEAIRKTREFSSLCPSTASFMEKSLG